MKDFLITAFGFLSFAVPLRAVTFGRQLDKRVAHQHNGPAKVDPEIGKLLGSGSDIPIGVSIAIDTERPDIPMSLCGDKIAGLEQLQRPDTDAAERKREEVAERLRKMGVPSVVWLTGARSLLADVTRDQLNRISLDPDVMEIALNKHPSRG